MKRYLKNSNWGLRLLVIVMLIVFLGLFLQQRQPLTTTDLNTQPSLTINDLTIPVAIADTPFLQQQGLSNRTSLPENAGMLFVFSEKMAQHFWMYNMLFPLDVVWISDQAVVGIEENIPTPSTESIPRFSSPVPVNYVLELNAGFIKKYGISIGDVVIFNL